MIEFNDFLKNPEDVLEFRHAYGVFKKDDKARSSLNKTLETEYRAVYRLEGATPWEDGNIDWDGETFYILTKKGRVLHHANSEWGGIGVAQAW